MWLGVIFLFVSISISKFGAASSQFFVCPDRVITLDDGPLGVIPHGRVGLSVVPPNYNCSYDFYIPPGFVLHFSISTHYESYLGDRIVFTNSLGEHVVIPTPNQHIDEWSASSTASLLIETVTNSSQMFAIYEFVNIQKRFKQKILPIGEYFALNNMKNTIYTFKSNNLIKINIAVKSTQDFDPHLEKIFVYDGPNIKSSKMIGRLHKFAKKPAVSTFNNITFVNLYNAPSTSFVIGNDFSIISRFTKYKAILMSKNQQTSGELFDSSNKSSAYTWICADCAGFYWNVLKFDKFRTAFEKAFIEVQPLSPSHQMRPILNYTAMEHSDYNFPQIIPTRMFTIINHYSAIGLTVDTSDISKSKWLVPYNGRRGIIHSPSIWDPNAKPSFNYTFEDLEQTFNFNISVQSVHSFRSDEMLTLRTGPFPDNQEYLFERFHQRQGSFMEVRYTGNTSMSYAVVKFDIEAINFCKREMFYILGLLVMLIR